MIDLQGTISFQGAHIYLTGNVSASDYLIALK